jgi:hypothetical protein
MMGIIVGIILFMLLMIIIGGKLVRKIESKLMKVVVVTLIYFTSCAAMMGLFKGFIITVFRFADKYEPNEIKVEYFDEMSKKYREMSLEQSELVLTRKDLGYEDKKEAYKESELEQKKTIFGEFYSATETGYDKKMESTDAFISYEYVKSNFDFILDSYVKSLIIGTEDDEIEYKESKEDAKLWKANKCYKVNGWGRGELDEDYDLVLEYDNIVINISYAYDEMIQNNIDVIYDRLVK